MNKLGRGFRDEGKDEDARAAFAQAEFFHFYCKGKGNCNCQHIVGVKMHD